MNLPRSIPAGFIRSANGEISHPRAYPGEVAAARGERKFTLTHAGVAEASPRAKELVRSVIANLPKSALEMRFVNMWGGPEFVRECRVIQERRWRFDFAWPAKWVAVEIEGGLHNPKHRNHTGLDGITGDCEKGNAAILSGWRVFRLTSPMITTENLNKIKEFLEKPISPAPPPGNG